MAKEPVIIRTLQAKPVVSMLLSRNILKGGNSLSGFCCPHQVLRKTLGKLHMRIFLIRVVGSYDQLLRTLVVAEGPPILGLQCL